MIKYLIFFCCLLTFEAGAQKIKISKNIQQAMNRIDTNTIRSHIAYLADDKLKGRLPGTEGFQLATDYVIDQYKQIGLLPGGDNGAFTQKLVIRKSVLQNSSSTVVLRDKNGNIDSLVFGSDYTPVPHPLKSVSSGEGQLIFAGYGVDIPGGYSDYSGIDVKGRIVVVINGAPPGLHSTITAHLANAGNKLNTAFSKGAVGVVMIDLAGRPSATNAVIQHNVALNPSKTAAYGRRFIGNLEFVLNGNKQLLSRLFFNSGKNLEEVLSALKSGKSSSFMLSLNIASSYTTTHSDFESHNIVGVIPGRDKELKNEYVVHSAHLDHVGIGRAVNGDSIYNGAHDNASGVASLLEIARVYKSSGAQPRRSVLIVMVTGEEMGLIGSSYFAANPTVPKASIVADINTDMPTLILPLLSIVPLGAEHSGIMQHVQFAAKQLGLDIEPDPEPSENRFVRSDQYSFVMNGIPALHVKYGNKTNIPGFNMIKFVKEWREKYYHKAADGMDGIFNFAAAKTYVQLNFLISYSIAQTTARPIWNEGDLFGIASKSF